MNEIPCVINKGFNELRQKKVFHIPLLNTIFFGANIVKFFGSRIWDSTPKNIKPPENGKQMFLEKIRDSKITIKYGNQHYNHVKFATGIPKILLAMCPPGYHHNDFVATHTPGCMM